MFTNVIGEKKAKELVGQILRIAEKKGLELPSLKVFVVDGQKVATVILPEILNEINIARSNGILRDLQASNQLREYFDTYLPSKLVLETIAMLGLKTVKKLVLSN